MRKYRVLFIILLLFVTGCAAWKTIPEKAKGDNPYFSTSLSTEDFASLALEINNKTEKNIEINWKKTFFIDTSGGTNGCFSSGKETQWEEKDAIIPTVIIFPHKTMSKSLWPLANRSWKRGWHWTYLQPGINGIFLTMIVDGKEITENLSFEVIKK